MREGKQSSVLILIKTESQIRYVWWVDVFFLPIPWKRRDIFDNTEVVLVESSAFGQFLVYIFFEAVFHHHEF